MKKTSVLVILLALAILTAAILMKDEERTVFFTEDGNGQMCLIVKYSLGEECIYPWYDTETDIWYYFMPNFVKKNVIYDKTGNGLLQIDGKNIKNGFAWQPDTLYDVDYATQYHVQFKESSEISTLFVNTESGSLDYVNADKSNKEKGKILSINPAGKIEYDGGIDKISGHGNGTWYLFEKRPYNIKLEQPGELGGLDGVRDWTLLAMSYEGDKIHSKLAYDIAAELGAPYTSQNTWVNVYLNGNYYGLYLLMEAVSGQDVFNTDGNFLMEKEISGRYEEEPYFHMTQDGNPLVIKKPREMSAKKYEEICHILDAAENMLSSGELDRTLIDVQSFAVQALTDEISLNCDAFRTSSYMYKLSGSETLYAGPAWDYDGAFGEYLHWGRAWTDPAAALDDNIAEDELIFTWYQKLYQNAEFREYKNQIFSDKQDYFDTLIYEDIDKWADLIACSVKNDELRWKWSQMRMYRAGSYLTWENDVRYLKWFLINRINYLCESENIRREKLVFGAEGEHEVVFMVNGETVAKTMIADGETIDFTKISELAAYDNMQWKFSYGDEYYVDVLPILEDCTLVINVE